MRKRQHRLTKTAARFSSPRVANWIVFAALSLVGPERAIGITLGVVLFGSSAALAQTGASPLDVEEEEEPIGASNSPAASAPKSPLDAEEEEAPLGSRPGAAARGDSNGGASPGVSPLDMESEEEEAPLGARPSPRVDTGVGGLSDLVGRGDGPIDDEGGVKSEPLCDILVASFSGVSGSRGRPIPLLSKWAGPPWTPNTEHEFVLMSVVTGKSTTKVKVLGKNIVGIQYYEERMIRLAAEELQMTAPELSGPLPLNDPFAPDARFDLSTDERRRQADRAAALLTTALAEHDSAVQRRIRVDPSFARHLRQPLVDALFNLQFSQIQMLYAEGRGAQALAACERLLDSPDLGTRGENALHAIIERVLLEPAFAAVRSEDWETCRAQLDAYRARFPKRPNADADRLEKGLIDKAAAIVARAEASKNPALLDEAARIWPRLSAIDATRRKLQVEHPTLNCAYTTLPSNFSPLSVETPADRHAVALMFESLVQWVEDPRFGPHYAAQLAAARPGPLAHGRQFTLPRCVWSDSDETSRYCTTEDVQATVDLLRAMKPASYPKAWDNLFDGLQYDDPFRLSLKLKADLWQPLSLMDFKILPAHRFPADERARDVESLVAAFRNSPAGTGPFRLGEPDDSASLPQIRFVANPHYRRAGSPKIREVVFHELDPVSALAEFEQGDIQLMYDVLPQHVVQLRQKGQTIAKLRGRSVHFLAINHRKNRWLQSAPFRLAIANAIDREKILNTVFRPGGSKTDHAALSGPFPKYDAVGEPCWAYNPKTPPYDTARASDQLNAAKATLGAEIPKLRLVYPARHDQTRDACEEIASQLRNIGIDIDATPIEPDRFHDEISRQHRFDLAYWRHDFEDATYSIWPLFDRTDIRPGGSNFMGCLPDEVLQSAFDRLRGHKEFHAVRHHAHLIHDHISRAALIVPLWQLDEYVAIQRNVRNAEFDPLDLFRNAENWEVIPQ